MPVLERLVDGLLRVPRVARQHQRIDAELGKSAIPFPVVIGREHDIVVRGDGKPAIGLDFSVELTWCPAGIAEGEEALTRTLIFADSAQDLKARRDRYIAVDMESRLLAIVGRVEHKTSACFDRASKMHRMQIDDSARFDVELREQLCHGQRAPPLIDDETHGACVVAVGAEINDRPSKPRVQHLWHRHQEMPCERLPTDHHFSHPKSRLRASTPIYGFRCAQVHKKTPAMHPRSDLPSNPLYAIGLPAGPLNSGNVSRIPGSWSRTPPEGYHDHQRW